VPKVKELRDFFKKDWLDQGLQDKADKKTLATES
jgi:hypothetical protein